MSRRISFDPKILPIIFDIWPPMMATTKPLGRTVETVCVLSTTGATAKGPAQCFCCMDMRRAVRLEMGEILGKVPVMWCAQDV